MKKSISLLLSVLLLMGAAVAYQLPFTNTYYNNNVFSKEYNNSSEAQAQMLYDLGLFKGRGEGDFVLNEKMTREEAAVMVVRFLGGETEAMEKAFSHPFTDVSPWAANYVGWLYENGFTKGISADKYGGKNLVTCWQYSTFLSRAIRGNEDGIATEDEVQLYDAVNHNFCRETAVGLSVRALSVFYDRVDSSKTCAEYLCSQGVFTAEQMRDAAVNVLPSDFICDNEGYILRETAGVPVAKSPMPGAAVVTDSEGSPRDYLHATAKTDGKMTLYILDYRTLEVRASDAYDSENALNMVYLTSSGEKDYLLEKLDGAFAGSLFAWDGKTLETVISAADLWRGQNKYLCEVTALTDDDRLYPTDAPTGNLFVAGTDSLFFVLPDGVKTLPMGENVTLLGWDGKGVALQTVSDTETAISCVDAATLAVTDEYRIAPDTKGIRTVGCERFYGDGNYAAFYGTAGYYSLSDGRLTQVTDLPVLKAVWRRVGAGGELSILSHDLDARMYDYRGRPTGNKIYYVAPGDNSLTLALEIQPEWNVRVDDWWSVDSVIAFSTCHAVGMECYDTYTYLLLGGKLMPSEYKAGRPEMMTQTWAEYVWDEMDRLYALGVSDPGPSQEDRANILAENAKTKEGST